MNETNSSNQGNSHPAGPRTKAPVVVGIDPGGRAASAVAWAAEEANRVHAPLRLVSAREEAVSTDELTHELPGLARRLARGQVEHREVPGSAPSVIRDAAQDAALAVTGRRSMSWLRRNVSASTSLALAATSPVPVVVVPENWVQPPLCARPVVLGLPPTVNGPWGPEDPCARALEFALERADDLRVPVRVVSVHPTGHPGWRKAEANHHERGRLTRGLDQRLRWWAQRYPHVELDQRAAFADAVPALLEASEGAQLVVLCRGTRFGVPHMLLGQTARSMVRRSRIPVAVVPGSTQTDEVLGR